MPRNAITVDVEDWHELVVKNLTGRAGPPGGRLADCMERLLSLFRESGVRATFFVLGMVAEHSPRVVERIAREGHEVATHGWGHDPLHRMTREEFRRDLERAREAIGQVTGSPPVGYRAPAFSVGRGMEWVFRELVRQGLLYDSSIFPIRHRRYGIPEAPRHPFRVDGAGGPFVEFPLATLRVLGVNLPAAGGGYFRLLPHRWIEAAARQLNAAGHPAVFYVHPYEFDPDRLRLDSARTPPLPGLRAARTLLVQNLGRFRVPAQVRRLAERFEFRTLRELAEGLTPVPGGDA